MTLNLTETSPEQVFDEPLTIDEVRSFIGLPERATPDPLEEAELEGYIVAARDVAEFHQGRDLVLKQYDLVMDCFPSNEIRLRDQVVSVDLVRYRNSDGEYTTLSSGTDYIADTAKQPGIVLPAYGQSWPVFTPWPSSAVLVRFTSGVAAGSFWTGGAGKRVKQGMQLLIAGWHARKIPFQEGASAVQEIPFGISVCLGLGGRVSVR